MGPEDEGDLAGNPSRARRAKALGAISLIVAAVACAAYLRPAMVPAAAPPAAPGLQVDAFDFVDPSTGWVLAGLHDRELGVLSTTDAGRHWRTHLLDADLPPVLFMRFFDRRQGVVVTGGDAIAFTTHDGGVSWSRRSVLDVSSLAISASFSDPLHGWVLFASNDGLPRNTTSLESTADGGVTWTRFGDTVTTRADPMAITFTDAEHGWLDAETASPSAYATTDGGATWQPRSLPAPSGGWPVPTGLYFVAVRATSGGGLIASVVNTEQPMYRYASGISVLGYPPLTVKTYDGGSPVVYSYSTFADSSTGGMAAENRPGPLGQVQATNQVVMTSLDGGVSWNVVSPPGAGGALGFQSAVDWWWIGQGGRAYTHDAGATWSPVSVGQPAQPIAGSLIVLDPKHAWIGAFTSDTETSLLSTADGGANWSAVKLPADQALT